MREGKHVDERGMELRIVTSGADVYVEMLRRHDTAQVFTSGKMDRGTFLRLLHEAGVL